MLIQLERTCRQETSGVSKTPRTDVLLAYLRPPHRAAFLFAAHSAGRGAVAVSTQFRKSSSARPAIAFLRSRPFSLPFTRRPSLSSLGVWISGKRPKFTFIGWNVFAPETCPPVMWAASAPWAVVFGGKSRVKPSRSDAANRPVRRPMAALST